ncbi:hypothetical protein CGRA01v4_07286 [Colletotrichum graminicola]|nr:hypothetical protein CGRA01v4_07286 [Colletotrichum graminicola]
MFWKRWLYGCLCVGAGAKDMTSRDGAVTIARKREIRGTRCPVAPTSARTGIGAKPTAW